jgi:hypothetical protein
LTVTNVAPKITTQPQDGAYYTNNPVTLSVVASGTAPLLYQWALNGTNVPGATGSSLYYAHITTNQAGNYTVIVSNVVGVVTSSVAVVTVQAAPYITSQPQSQDGLLGLTVTFTVSAMSAGPMTYQWYYQGSPVGGATSSTYSVLNLLGSDAGDYFVIISNAQGSTMSSIAHLGVVYTPTIKRQPVSQTVALGQSATFTVSGTNYPINYQWYFKGSALSGATDSSYAVNNAQTNNAGNYWVTLSNSSGSVTSSTATLTVNLPASISTPPQNQTLVVGQNAIFTVALSGTSPFSYQWSYNGNALSGATTSTLSVTNVQTNNAGSYSVAVGNSWGPATNATATLTVLVPPSITTPPNSQTAVVGQSVTFNVVATGTRPLKYQWYYNGSKIEEAGDSSLTLNSIQGSSTGNYKVVVTNNAGSVTSTVAILTVANPPTLQTTGMAGNGFAVQFSVPSGHTYIVMASTNLSNWAPIYTNSAQTTNITFSDSNSVSYPCRFYRVMVQ